MFRNLGKQILKVIIRFQIVCFCGFRNAVDDGAGLCTGNGIYHHPVFLADAKSADGLFRSVIVHRHFAIVQEHFQVFFLVSVKAGVRGAVELPEQETGACAFFAADQPYLTEESAEGFLREMERSWAWMCEVQRLPGESGMVF